MKSREKQKRRDKERINIYTTANAIAYKFKAQVNIQITTWWGGVGEAVFSLSFFSIEEIWWDG